MSRQSSDQEHDQFWSASTGRSKRRSKDTATWFDDDVIPVEPRQPGPSAPPLGEPEPLRRSKPRHAVGAHAAPEGQPPPETGQRPPRGRKPQRRPPARRPRQPRPRRSNANNWSSLAPVYDTDGPRVRLGLLWFAVAAPAVLAGAPVAAVVYGAVAGWAARQTALAWRCPEAYANLAVVLAAVPVVAAVGGPASAAIALGAVAIIAFIAGSSGTAGGLYGSTGHVAAIGVLIEAVIPVALAGAAVVVVRGHSPLAGIVLIGLVSAYEMGDFVVGSGSRNPVEGPLAGGAAVIVTGFPMALLLFEPFDVMGMAMLGVAALCCPVGQWIASAVLPKPGAHAPALRRIDSLLLLAPVWVLASGVF